jgi:hypothetical protein
MTSFWQIIAGISFVRKNGFRLLTLVFESFAGGAKPAHSKKVIYSSLIDSRNGLPECIAPEAIDADIEGCHIDSFALTNRSVEDRLLFETLSCRVSFRLFHI